MRLLRQALEADTPETGEPTVMMKGPLAEAYTQALDIAYKKDEQPSEEIIQQVANVKVGLESQAIDSMLMQKMASAIKASDSGETDPGYMTVYGVSENEITEDTVVDLTKDVVSDQRPQDYVLIIDGTQPGANSDSESAPVERIQWLSNAMEAIVQSHGGKVYRSLGEFIKSR